MITRAKDDTSVVHDLVQDIQDSHLPCQVVVSLARFGREHVKDTSIQASIDAFQRKAGATCTSFCLGNELEDELKDFIRWSLKNSLP